MSTKRAEVVSGYRSVLVAVLFAIALCFGSAGGPAQVNTLAPQEIDARTAIELLSNALAQGRRDTFTDLSRLGFAAEVEELRKLDGNPRYAFSSQTIIENLYRRAEAHEKGEGDRFLAVLYQNAAAKKSAALAVDPELKALRTFTPDQLNIKVHPIKFSSIQTISDVNTRPPLHNAVNKAIVKLSEFYSGRGLAQARVAVLRNFRKQGFDGRAFEQALANSKTTEEALRRMVMLGTPPPPEEVALRGVLRETIAGSAALSVDRGALEIMEELSGDLPAEVERYIKVEDRLESRKLQMAEAAKIKRPGKTQPREGIILIGKNDGGPPDLPHGGSPSGGGGGGGAGGGGKKGGPPRPASPSGIETAESGQFTRAYDNYTRQTFEPRPPARPNFETRIPTYRPTSPGTSRSYRLAIRSARAARGIALGGKVNSEIKEIPVSAFWLANQKDDRFGRLFVQFPSAKGRPPLVGASRVLFADSFYAASSLLWGGHGEEAAFRDGEILLLMSMDPAGQVTQANQEAARKEILKGLLKKLGPAERQQTEKALEDLEKASAQRQRGDPEALLRLVTLQNKVNQLLSPALAKLGPAERKQLLGSVGRLRATRGVVTHPAIFGRELAWSAVRVDFWFNRLDRLSSESVMMNGGRSMPASFKNLPLSKAATWQFFEQDSLIRLGQTEGRARRLEVISKNSGESTPGNPRVGSRSHFGISMFGQSASPGAKRVEDGLYRLEDLESEVQPLLDWLAVNHHDYMRLNDLSEAFSLLRWLRSAQAKITIMDMNGQGKAIATPDRVEIGNGPRVGGR